MPLQSLNPPARLVPLFTVWKQQQGVSVLAGFMSPKPLAEHALPRYMYMDPRCKGAAMAGHISKFGAPKERPPSWSLASAAD